MENTKTSYQYLNDDGNWYPIEIKKCDMTRARGTINQGRPYQPVYIKDGKEHTIRYRKVSIESAIAELQCVIEHGDGTCNGKRYRLAIDEEDVSAVSKSPLLLRMFVYGTLKRGCWNHAHFCGGAVSIEEATVRGRLYELPSGIPVLVVPEEAILALGTDDPLTDIQTQHEVSPCVKLQWSTDWCVIHGEIITFNDPAISLPAIDRLEGFHPEYHCVYNRVLMPAKVFADTLAAWCYVASSCSISDAFPLGKTSWP